MDAKPVIAYFRVSTERQGRSGLGLEAQRERCQAFAAQNGLEVADSFTEVETGKGSDALNRRPQLAAALAAAKRLKCSVLVAKDALRFAQNVLPIIERIRASGVTSMRGIAAVLDARGVRTARGGNGRRCRSGPSLAARHASSVLKLGRSEGAERSADTSRSASKLSITIQSFSSSDQRRRRPSSTTARRSGCK